MSWENTVSQSEAFLRASGRRRYNATRRIQREIRQAKLLELMKRWNLSFNHRGVGVRLAKHLQIHPSTVCRDIKQLLRH